MYVPKRISDAQAEAEMRAVGLEPLEPYPTSTEPWRARCTRCDNEVQPRLMTIRQGSGGCRFCGSARIGEALRTPADIAERDMRAAGLTPLEPFPGHGAPWRCTCDACGREVTPCLGNIRAGHGGCRSCGARKTATRLDPAEAEADMRAVGLEPLVPYPGAIAPWLSRCAECNREVTPRLNDIRKGQRGCRYCGYTKKHAARVDANTEQAEADMRKAGLRPLEPYRGRHIPWRCECFSCGREVTPQLGSIRSGRDGCRYCSLKKTRTRDTDGVTLLYVLHHPHHGAVKIGIAGRSGVRLAKFQKMGWLVITVIHFPTIQRAYTVEQATLTHLRQHMGLSHYLTPDYMGKLRGWTETFDAELITPHRLTTLAREEAARAATPAPSPATEKPPATPPA